MIPAALSRLCSVTSIYKHVQLGTNAALQSLARTTSLYREDISPSLKTKHICGQTSVVCTLGIGKLALFQVLCGRCAQSDTCNSVDIKIKRKFYPTGTSRCVF